MEQSATLLEVLSRNATSQGSKTLFSWVGDKGDVEKSFTYAQFESVTTSMAEALGGPWGLKQGETVLLVYPPGLDFIVTFFACLKAGVVAVPVYPPRPGLAKDVNMFIGVQKSSGASVALTNSYYDFAKRSTAIKQKLLGGKLSWPTLRWVVTDSKVPKGSALGSVKTSGDRLAFLQYTSGSTAAPKGVMVSHGNLTHNLSCIVDALEAGKETVVVSWLPQYHDMGLIGSHMGAIYCGGTAIFMSPISFIKNPALWIEMISKYQATHIQAPNFAYKLVVRKWNASTRKPVDLSSVVHIFNAAEPIDGAAIDLFNSTFGPFGLKPSAMSPGYGLAEHTVYVCDKGKQRIVVDKLVLETDNRVVVSEGSFDRSKVQEIVGCGFPHRKATGIQVRIVDPNTCVALEEDVVGEIWVDSPSKAQGYYKLDEKTNEDFHGKIRSGTDEEALERSWLRTGDLGFFHNDELFICGRSKDLIIIRGRNHFPQDIEQSVEQTNDLVRPGCVAAFTVKPEKNKSSAELLVIVAELRSNTDESEAISQAIRKRITNEHGISPYMVVLIKERSIPKTTSGKISRFRVRQALEGGSLDELFRWTMESSALNDDEDAQLELTDDSNFSPLVPIEDPPRNGLRGEALLDALKDEVARLLESDIENVEPSSPLIGIGMDSMALTQFKGILENSYNTVIEEIELFDDETTLLVIKSRVEGAPPNPKFQTANPDIATPSAKPKKRKQKTFGCFAICGC